MDRFGVSNSSVVVNFNHPRPGGLHGDICKLLVGLFFTLGVAGNFLALVILTKKRNAKNSKYTFMLKCLCTNNLIGLLGMSAHVLVKTAFPRWSMHSSQMSCASMVVWRFFGVSSGCIAAVMAMERWMALARPFTYHKHITYNVVKKTIHALIAIATVVTFLPFVGFGVYFDEANGKCVRYRDATTLLAMSYAILFMVFGMLLCVVIVVCNLFVARVLYHIGQNKTLKRSVRYDLVNRDRRKDSENPAPPLFHTTSSGSDNNTPSKSDEMKFAKLMAFLSISFVICWMPQMISIILALKPNPLQKTHWFFKIADTLIALHFTSDPYIYVLSRNKNSYILGCIKHWRHGLRRSHSDPQSRQRPTMEQTLDYGLNS